MRRTQPMDARTERALRLYLQAFRPLAPALSAIGFLVAWFATGHQALLDVTLGLCGSVGAAVVYLALARLVPARRVFVASLFVDEAIIVWLITRVPNSGALSVALLWSVALGGIFLGPRQVLAVTAVATALFVATPLTLGAGPVQVDSLIAGAIIFAVIGSAIAFVRSEELGARRALERSERLLAEAQRVAAIGSWEWDPASGELAWSDQMRRMWGVGPEEPVTVERFAGLLHPDDRDRVLASFTRTADDGSPSGEDFRVLRPDGTVITMQSRGETIVGDDGERLLVGTTQDVTELRLASDLQREFVATASHELRTPAAIVSGFAITLDERWNEVDEPMRLQMVRAIRAAADRLAQLIEDVLHVSRIESGKMRVRPEPVDLGALLHRATADLDDGRISLECSVDARAVTDPARLRQVLDNLLGNAIRYARSEVLVRCRIEDGMAVVYVDDDGPGIPAADRKRVFERFVRLSTVSPEAVRGTGLGLYIARELAQLCGGELTLGSSAVGGASFRCTIPLVDRAQDPQD